MIGDTLAPSLDYSDFEMGYRAELQQTYPRYTALIAQLTRQEFLARPQTVATPPPAPTPSGDAGPAPVAISVDQVRTVQASAGLALAKWSEESERPAASVAASPPSRWRPQAVIGQFNKEAEEYFIVTEGTGRVRVGSHEIPVVPGTVVVVPAGLSIGCRPVPQAICDFYAISAPAFSPEDYVVTSGRQH